MYIFQPGRYLLNKQVQNFSQYIRGKVLDVGAGSFSRYECYFKFIKYIKTDYLPGPNVDVVASADDLPFLKGEFDSVISTQVFEHLEYPEKATAEISRVLKVGGHLLITVPQWSELHEEPHDYWRYTCFGLASLFERNGFSVIEHEQLGGFFSTCAQMSMRYLIDFFQLYRSWWSRPVSGFFKILGKLAIWLDKIDTSEANRKHTIGWIFVLRKNK